MALALSFLPACDDVHSVIKKSPEATPKPPSASQKPADIGYGAVPLTVQKKMQGVSYTKGTPVKMSDLAYVRVRHIGFDGKEHRGELVIHQKLAKEVFEIFEELYGKKFPIEKMRLVEEYGGSDDRSMAANNTSAFNTRPMAEKNKLSLHSYGMAIDINPVQNPMISGKKSFPPIGASYASRKIFIKGMILKGDAAYSAFIKRGWTWGGNWTSPKDYQHFEKKIK